MRMSDIFDALEMWQAPKRLTIEEQDDVATSLRKAREYVEEILFIIEEQNPPTPKSEPKPVAQPQTSGLAELLDIR